MSPFLINIKAISCLWFVLDLDVYHRGVDATVGTAAVGQWYWYVTSEFCLAVAVIGLTRL